MHLNSIPNISYTVSNHLCTGCGVCEGACPTQSISMNVKNGQQIPYVDKDNCINGKGCHKCYDVCPGIGVKLNGISEQYFSEGSIIDETIGRFLNCYTGYSTDYDIQYHSASGGCLSQFLIYLLEKGHIDGAYVTAFSPDKELLVSSYIAKTKEDILRAKSSKYAPVSLNKAISDIKNDKGKSFVIVGLPCHIEGFRKYEAIDTAFKNKILGYLGLYCSSGRSFNMTEYLFKSRGLSFDNISSFAYRDEGCLGSMKVDYHDSKKSYLEEFTSYYKLRSIFVPHRCMFCIDHFNELSDVSFGDIHIAPYKENKVGINSIVTRNPLFDQLLNEAAKDNAISLNVIDKKVLLASQVMAKKKKGRNGTFIKIHKLFGGEVPDYDCKLNDSYQFKSVLDYVHTIIQIFIGSHKKLWFVIPLIKNK
jgi:coenzyme F420 hydrogenase subunit beta